MVVVVVENEVNQCLFTMYVSFRQTPLTRLSKRERGRLHDLLRKITNLTNLNNAVPLSFYI